jgi:L-2-hydroxyglutarate oxidase LhgO
MEHVGCVVVGAGVVGLACARRLAQTGRDVLVLERAPSAGTETSSRNSGVIHAGLYYAPGTARARLCVPGRNALYTYCEARGIAARRCGKLIVACDAAEQATLQSLAARAAANGVDDLQWLSAAEAAALEPALRCTDALLSPSTGIVDALGLMGALQQEAQDAGTVFAFRAPFETARVTRAGFDVEVGGAAPIRLGCDTLVNAAGLHACAVAAGIDGLEPAYVPRPYFAKGSYFELSGSSPFSRLIYPVPIPGGAGIHLTLDFGGQARFGPDVEAVDKPDYRVDPASLPRFETAIRRYWPGLPDGALRPGYAGVRPKIVPPAHTQDFVLQGEAVHGVPGLINLFGIESPGLTACLAIADHVRAMIADPGASRP